MADVPSTGAASEDPSTSTSSRPQHSQKSASAPPLRLVDMPELRFEGKFLEIDRSQSRQVRTMPLNAPRFAPSPPPSMSGCKSPPPPPPYPYNPPPRPPPHLRLQPTQVIQSWAENGEDKIERTFNSDRVVGNGSFGVVFMAKCVETDEKVAIKKVLQDRRFKNRELDVMRMVSHPNIVQLMHCFFTYDRDEMYLNLVLEYVPDTVYRISKQYAKRGQRMPVDEVRMYVYQICRALHNIHDLGVCHRDIKPQNLLVDAEKHELKLCDFGSAKQLRPGEPNISYICSRYYRAPELIFGATDYTTRIDMWSVGCVMAELFLGMPLFPGESGVDQLVEIIKVLGTPTRDEIRAMNPNYTEFKFPQIKAHPWSRVFSKSVPQEAIDLLTTFLQYDPKSRTSALEAMAHPFFDPLRKNGGCVGGLEFCNWTPGELDKATPELRKKLTPEPKTTS